MKLTWNKFRYFASWSALTISGCTSLIAIFYSRWNLAFIMGLIILITSIEILRSEKQNNIKNLK